MDGFFLINKEPNMTSHDVVYKIKKKFNFTKTGHTGILDPMAKGLLIVLINRATKLAFLFEHLNKGYQGNMVFNKQYDTLDITGTLTAQKEIPLTNEMVQESFRFFDQKQYLQKPPLYSAIKVKGGKLYDLARKNIEIDVAPRKVKIYHLEIVSALKNDQIEFVTNVSKGTYIRSLARDIGEKMNTYGSLQSLTRTQIGSYDWKRAKKIDEVSLEDLNDVKILFQNHKQILLNDYLVRLVQNGVYLDERQIITDEPFVVLDQKENWVAYYEPIKKNKYRPRYFF
ncbi:MAG: tRNA pseudouridine synthase B [Candidatus Phytoplasma pruni]|uniref:tRNA pseudouridine(55) synthase TruB n=1 Tax=Poinsettia branch-inducing phytoplasma TaxID=138647 RepID=UPI0003661DAA|nr:tRNA pseudouridine(55) synthase TruB [Poinsettia branch-inducing phytoplasma]WEK82251.1 MAG: tRNA pseudouridine synthase B [Candidatus Phytoplasma pruni]